ncbi:hypothetical protein [Deinococcus koreensis]|nr:hypothetical protein [Deinococcus koreensis]
MATPTSQPALTIQTFGGAAITLDGQEIAWPSASARDLLSFPRLM